MKGLDGIAVTDHNTIRGGVETEKSNKSQLEIIIGSEIKTEYGDIIGLFLNEEIKSTTFWEVIDEINSQSGLVVLPHPFRKNKVFPSEFINKIDFKLVLVSLQIKKFS